MRTSIKKIFCFILIAAILLTAFLFMPARQAEALDFTKIQTRLNTWQYYFCRTFMSLALKDYYDTGILPSITVGQAYYEGGCAGHPISVIGKNHFGIKAYPSTWSGPIYEEVEDTLYNSYNDLVNIKGIDFVRTQAKMWRAYSTWEEGVKGHSDLFAEEKKYIPVFEAADYVEAANAIMNAGYAGNSSTYASNLIRFIEENNFAQLDSVTYDENGIFGIVMSKAEVSLDIGETLQMDAIAYPETEYDYRSETVWTSDNPEVVTVDETGNLTAVGHGYALVTADYGEKEACCVVSVGCNATVMIDRDFKLFAEPDSDSDSMGKLLIGQPIHVNSKSIFEGEDGNLYYAVTAMNSSGKVVSGYANIEYIYTGGDIRVSVGTPLTILHLEVDTPYEIPLEIHADELKEKEITWVSSDEEILTVDENGIITPLAEGVAIVSVLLDGEVSLTVTVYVGEAGYEDIIATTAVYVRDSCDGKANVIGLVRKGHSVKLLCDLGDGWYRVLANVEGEYVIGYSYSRYYRFSWEPDPDESSDDPSTDPSGDPSGDISGNVSDDSSESSNTPSDPSDDTSGTTSGETVVILLSTGEVDVDDYLNVRKSAGTKGERLVRIPNGTPVVIQNEVFVDEETTYKQWYKITFTFEKKNYEGFVAAEFIRLVGTTEKTIPDEPITSERYTKDDVYLYGVLPKTEKTAFLEELGRTVLLYRTDGKAVADGEILHTGDKLDFYIGEFYVYTRTVIVFGDVSGDGQINAVDYTAVKAQVLRTYELSDEQKKAAAVAGKETISALDYMLLKAIVLGTHTLE